jgi:digeranylgeranylglycerophospholipid reductase
MKYDLIVAGGGPAGLMAAETAAEDGLNVRLIERKKDITEINRTCAQMFYINHLGATKSGIYCFREPVNLEIGKEKNRFIFPTLGFSVDYRGHLSPSGYIIDRYPKHNDKPITFFFQKEAFLSGLLSEAEKAGVDIITETMALSAENTPDGVRVTVQTRSGEQILEARKAIAADGIESNLVEGLGLNQDRQVLSPRLKGVGYVMEGVENNLPASFLLVSVPSINRSANVCLYTLANGQIMISTGTSAEGSPSTALDEFMKLPRYAPWFKNARLLRKTAYGNFIRTPVKEPVIGNVLIAGDAGATIETLIQGAIACGYLGTKAIEKELNGQSGYQEYIDWWQQAFEFNDPTYFSTVNRYFSLNSLCSDEEVDYLYKTLAGKVGVPAVLIEQNLELFKNDRPELYEKLLQKQKQFINEPE